MSGCGRVNWVLCMSGSCTGSTGRSRVSRLWLICGGWLRRWSGRTAGRWQSSPPMPFLFQRKIGTKHEVMSDTTVVNMLKRHCVELAEQHPGFLATSFTPHDFRRLLATELVNSGLPIHIGAALLGHLNLQTTRGYVAVFNEDVVRHYQGFLDRRRQARPTDEYRSVTEPEWLGFEEHFDQRKVELGGCARPYSTPCQHEHACLRCPMINFNPRLLPRLDEIEVDLLA